MVWCDYASQELILVSNIRQRPLAVFTDFWKIKVTLNQEWSDLQYLQFHVWKICEGEPVIVDRQHSGAVVDTVPSLLTSSGLSFIPGGTERRTYPGPGTSTGKASKRCHGETDKWEAAQDGSGSRLALLCGFSPSKTRIWGLATLNRPQVCESGCLGLHAGAATCPNSLYPEGSLDELQRPSSAS